jgi:hypothetical protein
MKRSHEGKKKPKRVAEPVQVYLDPEERARLARLTAELDTSKSDVLRRGLEALERQLGDPEAHPVLRIIGLAGAETSPPIGYDVAREHDRYLTDSEVKSWGGEPGRHDA